MLTPDSPPNPPPGECAAVPGHKVRLIGEAGVRHMLVSVHPQLRSQGAGGLHRGTFPAACSPLREICVGEDWAFGKERAGNLALLASLGASLGFTATGIPAVTVDGRAVSSTVIRAAVESGALDVAARLLGRDFSVFGTVIEGRKLGRTLGFPTANVRPESEQLPPNGVYVVRVALDGSRREGIANVGVRPTVAGENAQRLVEVHLFGFARRTLRPRPRRLLPPLHPPRAKVPRASKPCAPRSPATSPPCGATAGEEAAHISG